MRIERNEGARSETETTTGRILLNVAPHNLALFPRIFQRLSPPETSNSHVLKGGIVLLKIASQGPLQLSTEFAIQNPLSTVDALKCIEPRAAAGVITSYSVYQRYRTTPSPPVRHAYTYPGGSQILQPTRFSVNITLSEDCLQYLRMMRGETAGEIGQTASRRDRRGGAGRHWVADLLAQRALLRLGHHLPFRLLGTPKPASFYPISTLQISPQISLNSL
jgi:hypothetical protein